MTTAADARRWTPAVDAATVEPSGPQVRAAVVALLVFWHAIRELVRGPEPAAIELGRRLTVGADGVTRDDLPPALRDDERGASQEQA